MKADGEEQPFSPFRREFKSAYDILSRITSVSKKLPHSHGDLLSSHVQFCVALQWERFPLAEFYFRNS